MPTEWIVKKLRQGMFSDTLLQMAADKIEELERQQFEWIDVNERLPEEDTRVLVVLSQEAAMTYTKMDTDRINDGKWVRWHNRITHWMPLPEPPKVGDV